MKDNVGRIFILNNQVLESQALGEVDTSDGKVVYEVIRIIDGIPLFLNDHYERMKDSLKALEVQDAPLLKDLKLSIEKLATENKLENFNAKLIVYQKDGLQNMLLYVSKHYYPSVEEFSTGVDVSLLTLERKNPNAKLVNKDYKEEVAKKIDEDKVFEVLLVNGRNKITEGSRSNVFFVKGKKIYTAPGDQILKGITRQYIIDVCEKIGFEVIETLISVESLNDIEGAFISGTSIKVLPVKKIDNKFLDSAAHSTIIAVRDSFDRMIEEFVEKNS